MEDAFFRPGSASSYDELNTTLKRSKEKIVELIKEGVVAIDMDLVTCVIPDYSKEAWAGSYNRRHVETNQLRGRPPSQAVKPIHL